MMPDNELSTTPVFGYYLYPDSLDPTKLISYEYGGIAINDGSEGLLVQVWTARLEIDVDTSIGTVYLSSPNTPEYVLFAEIGITEISLAFDRNMRPFIAFMQSGQARYWWYDSVDEIQKFSDLPLGSRSPKCCHDDKRVMESASSDIILCYIRDDVMYTRMQRDRYLVEYEQRTGVTQDIIQVGMSSVNRLQFAVGLYP